MQHYDQIRLHDLELRCYLGVHAWEQQNKQTITISITLHTDTSKAGKTDNLEDTIDYEALRNDVIKQLGASRFQLLEKLTEETASICLKDKRIFAVDIASFKPHTLQDTSSVSVKIHRENG